MKIPKSPEEVEHFTSLFLETHGFPKCLGATDGTHNDVIEPRYHYPDYIHRKGYTSVTFHSVLALLTEHILKL